MTRKGSHVFGRYSVEPNGSGFHINVSGSQVADLFHALRALGQPLGSAIGRQFAQLKKQHSRLSEQLVKTSSEAKCAEIQEIISQLAAQQQRLQEDQRIYHQSLHAITQTIHPFNITTGDWQLWQDLSTGLSSPLEQLRSLARRYSPSKGQTAINVFTSANSFLCSRNSCLVALGQPSAQ